MIFRCNRRWIKWSNRRIRSPRKLPSRAFVSPSSPFLPLVTSRTILSAASTELGHRQTVLRITRRCSTLAWFHEACSSLRFNEAGPIAFFVEPARLRGAATGVRGETRQIHKGKTTLAQVPGFRKFFLMIDQLSLLWRSDPPLFLDHFHFYTRYYSTKAMWTF